MGSPVSPVVANLYIEDLVLESAHVQPRLWRRYVDDTFCIVKKRTADQLLNVFVPPSSSPWSWRGMALFPSWTPSSTGGKMGA